MTDSDLTRVVVSKETVNDDSYLILEFNFSDGDAVQKGDVIGVLETSKSVVDVESPAAGYIFYFTECGTRIAVGTPLAIISRTPERPTELHSQVENVRVASGTHETEPGVLVSPSAQQLMSENDLTVADFGGAAIIRTDDVRRLLANRSNDDLTLQGPENSNQIVLLGGGGHSHICIDIIRAQKMFTIAGIVDSGLAAGSTVMGIPVLGSERMLPELFQRGIRAATITFGSLKNASARADAFNRLDQLGFLLPALIHPSATVEASATLGRGVQVMAGAIVGSCARIADNCIVNAGSIVSHDCCLDNNVHLTPGCVLAGNVHVGANTIVGMGVTVLYGARIGKNVIINNGVNVINDVQEGQVIKS